MNARRRVILLVVCIVLGAMVNIVFAWGCAMWTSGDVRTVEQMSDEEASDLWRKYAPPEHSLADGGHFGLQQRAFGTLTRTVDAGTKEPQPTVLEFRAGWPLQCVMAYGLHYPDQRGIVLNRIWQFQRDVPWLSIKAHRSIPYGPIWFGLAINTVFFTGVLWLLIRGPLETRRRWRELRGRCGMCGFPIGASPVCAECGADLSRAWGRSSRTPIAG